MKTNLALFVFLLIGIWAIDMVFVNVIEPRMTTEMFVEVENSIVPIENLRAYSGNFQTMMHSGSSVITVIAFFIVFGKTIKNAVWPSDKAKNEYRK